MIRSLLHKINSRFMWEHPIPRTCNPIRVSFSGFVVMVLSYAAVCAAFDAPDPKAYAKFLSGAPFEEQPPPSEPQIDNSINPEAYFIGGGDVFQISVVQSPSIQYTGTVNENCDVYVPELGIIKIGKTRLSQAKKVIAEFVASKLRKQFEVYVSIVKTKTAVVSVSGAVANPGTYRIAGTFRLLDAIRAANNGALPSYNECNYRETECRNRDSTRVYDLFKYLFVNDLDQNPYVYPGDNIRIPLTQRRVMIRGSIRSQVAGMVPIRQDEQAADFLSLFAFDASADSDHIIIQRVNPDNSCSVKIISIRQPVSFPLKDRDLVIVSEKENYPQTEMVTIRGEITRPGLYPMAKNATKAEDVVLQAGGPTKLGNADRAYVIRHRKMLSDEMKQNYASLKPVTTTGLFDNSVRPEVNAGLIRMNASNDFSVLRFSDNKDGILLESDDEIVIPKKEYCVYVSGSVRHPGAYPFSAGGGKDHYIGLAGGYSSKADRGNSFVVTYYGMVMQVKENGALEEGDVIVVPDSQEFKFLTIVFIPIVSAIAITISTILALYTSAHH
jgi:protein involved in polysaccharide export with SLBB domain